MMHRELIERMYGTFNRRDIDATLALMADDVSWPKASEGGRVVGKEAIRAYWTRQWSEFDPYVDVIEVTDGESGTIDVEVRQLVRSLYGKVLSDTKVRHVYTITNGLIERMDVDAGEGASEGPSAAFSHDERVD